MNYFDHPVTNAYAGSLNNLIRVMNRLGRGYSFEALRAKILFTEGAHFKQAAALANAFVIKDASATGMQNPSETLNFGADMSKLAQLIESGKL